jgi:hypothetical protein
LTIRDTEQFFRELSEEKPDIDSSWPALTFWVVIGSTIFIVSVGIEDESNSAVL